MLQFWTGWSSLPIIGEKLTVTFFPKDVSNVLAVSDSCFKSLAIPVIHTKYETFRKKMDVAITYGKVGFGRI